MLHPHNPLIILLPKQDLQLRMIKPLGRRPVDVVPREQEPAVPLLPKPPAGLGVVVPPVPAVGGGSLLVERRRLLADVTVQVRLEDGAGELLVARGRQGDRVGLEHGDELPEEGDPEAAVLRAWDGAGAGGVCVYECRCGRVHAVGDLEGEEHREVVPFEFDAAGEEMG